MTVQAEPAIEFTCEKCNRVQYHDYSLDQSWYENRAVMADNILCSYCGHDNHVIQEI